MPTDPDAAGEVAWEALGLPRADRTAAIGLLNRTEQMDPALLLMVACCAFHAAVRRATPEMAKDLDAIYAAMRSCP